MLVFHRRRPPVRGRILSERGQGLARLLAALAVIFWLIAEANKVM